MTTLETNRLAMRPWRVGAMDDAKALFRYDSNPKVKPAAAWPTHRSVEESAASPVTNGNLAPVTPSRILTTAL